MFGRETRILSLQIIGLAIFFALFCRAKGKDKDKEAAEFIDDDQTGLEDDEEYLHSDEVRLHWR
jgi:hypothetical protein